MAQLDIQINEQPPRARRQRQDYRLTQQPRPRGLIGQISLLLLQPGDFFRGLPAFSGSRQWLLVAGLLLVATGAMAVRQAELNASPGSAAAGPGMEMPGEMFDPRMGGGSGGIDFGGLPPDLGMNPDMGRPGGPTGATGGGGVATTWTTALVAAGGLLAAWFVQALLLAEVTLFNGRAPRLGRARF